MINNYKYLAKTYKMYSPFSLIIVNKPIFTAIKVRNEYFSFLATNVYALLPITYFYVDFIVE